MVSLEEALELVASSAMVAHYNQWCVFVSTMVAHYNMWCVFVSTMVAHYN